MMKSPLLLPLLLLALTVNPLRADDPLHRIRLTTCEAFEVLAPSGAAWLDVYAVSEGMRRVVQNGSRKTVEAADYATRIDVRTSEPRRALAEILRQIHEATGRPLASFTNSGLTNMAPSAMLMAMDATSVWCLVLTPKGDPNTFHLTCGYVIDRAAGQSATE